MKTLTVKQPWASLIVEGIKPIENRTWQTHYRGIFQIHSSAQASFPIAESIKYLTYQQWDACPLRLQNLFHNNFDNVPFSAIIGEVELVACVKGHESIWADKECWNWVLAKPIKYKKPIMNIKGALSFWEYVKK